MSTDLRPLSLGELLDRTFTYYREHFWTFVGIMAPAEAAAIAVTLVFQAVTVHAGRHVPRGANPLQVLTATAPVLEAMITVVLVGSLARMLALAASSTAVSRFHLGGSITIKEAYSSLRGSVWRLIALYGLLILITLGVSALLLIAVIFLAGIVGSIGALAGGTGQDAKVVVGAVVIVAMIGASILGLVILLRFALAVPALILERLSPMRALRRSSFLARGFLWRILVACLLMYLIVLVVAFTFEAPFRVAGLLMGFRLNHDPIWLAAPSVISAGIGAALSYPVVMIVLPLFYYEARVRKEGFDLQMMMSGAGGGTGAAAIGRGIVADAELRLPRTGVLLVILLTIVTFYLYEPIWYLNRLAAFNRLNTREKLPRALFIVLLALYGCVLTATVAISIAKLPDPASTMVHSVALAVGITLLIQAFKVRRMIEQHVNARIGGGPIFVQPESLSGVAVFFFHHLYLQYKINELFDTIYAAPAMDGGAVPGSGMPAAAAGPV